MKWLVCAACEESITHEQPSMAMETALQWHYAERHGERVYWHQDGLYRLEDALALGLNNAGDSGEAVHQPAHRGRASQHELRQARRP